MPRSARARVSPRSSRSPRSACSSSSIVRLVPRLGHPGWAVALGFLCAGVSGNLVDRLFRAPAPLRGHVVDFLQLPYWPIFNVADMCISTAAVMIVILAIIKNVGVDGQRHGRD